MEDHRTEYQRSCSRRCGLPMRGVIGLLAFFALVCIFAHRLSIAFVVNMMVGSVNQTDLQNKDHACHYDSEKILEIPNIHHEYRTSQWSESLEKFILPCFFIGYILTQLPGGVVSDLYGAKWVLSVSILFSSLATMIVPIAMNDDTSISIIVLRIFLGAAQGPIVPSINTLLSSWVPKRERATLTTLAYSGVPMGIVLTGYSSAYLLTNVQQWHITHHVFGSMGLFCFLLIVSAASSHPSNHPCIRPEEVLFLNEQIKTYEISFSSIPWKAIMLNKPVISVIIGQMGHEWGYYLVLTGVPQYLRRVIRISPSDNGFSICLPFMAMFVWINLAGMLADWVVKTKTMKVATQRKLYTLLGAVFPGSFALFASFAECHKFLVITFLSMTVITTGFYYSGLRLSPMDLSKSYSGTLMGIVNGFAALSGVCLPIVTTLLTPHDTIDEWRNVFWLSFFIVTITALIFVKWGSADVQPFDPSFSHEEA